MGRRKRAPKNFNLSLHTCTFISNQFFFTAVLLSPPSIHLFIHPSISIHPFHIHPSIHLLDNRFLHLSFPTISSFRSCFNRLRPFISPSIHAFISPFIRC